MLHMTISLLNGAQVFFLKCSPWLCICMPYDHIPWREVFGIGLNSFKNDPTLVNCFIKRLALFTYCARSYGPMCPGARRLGAGAPITVLQFAPLARLHPVLGLNTNLERVLGSSTQRCVLANQSQQA
jgi:hypothetical protein